MKNRALLIAIILLPNLVLSCNLSAGISATLSPAELQAFTAQTLTALAAPVSGVTPATAEPAADTPTLTLLPSVTPETILPSNTTTPTITPTALPCNWAKFISDVTAPDDWQTTPSDHFTKTWRLQNIGSCTWTSGYSLIFLSGDQMGAPASQQLTPGTVPPGGTLDLSVNLVSPAAAGTYQGYFKLQAPDHSVFGIGANANNPFWVKIKVVAPGVTLLAPFIPFIPFVIAPTTAQVSQTKSIAPGTIDSASAACPDGSVVTGGGFSTGSDMIAFTQLKMGNGWTVFAKNNSASAQNLIAYAMCLTYAGATTNQVINSTTAGGGMSVGLLTSCPAGTVLTGGGYTGSGDGNLWTSQSQPVGNSWGVSVTNTGLSGILFNVYAICLSGTSLTETALFSNTSVAAGATGLAQATCPAGKVTTGGGFNIHGAAPDIFVFFLTFSGGDWRTYTKNNGAGPRVVDSYAVCIG